MPASLNRTLILITDLSQLATQSVAGDTEAVVALARIERLHRPRAPFLIFIQLRVRFHAAAEHEITRRAVDVDDAGTVLVTNLVVAHVGRARCGADDSDVVVADADVAVTVWIVKRPFPAISLELRMTAENLLRSDHK